MTTIVIPAHNESQVIGRLLRQIVPTPPDDEFDIVVVANGCTDGTAEVAARFGPNVRVLSIPIASKYAALAAGDSAADGSAADFPRVYIDADVELRAEDIRALAMALRQPGVLAAAPDRILDLVGRPWTVRWYYDVWTRLPEVQRGMFGRGVFAVSEVGYQRLASLPQLLADDLAASLSFAPHERVVVPGARVIFHISRTFSDMLRRRIRAATGVAQIERTERAPASVARTRMSDLLAIIRAEPRMAPRVALFLSVAITARLGARRAVATGDYTTWLRDESSRRLAMADDVIADHSPAQGHQTD